MSAPIDLRSDTVTKPSDAMRRAMAAAEVGDDWYGNDPTVNRLQDRAAEITGKGAALFVPTGTMANQIGLRSFVPGAGHLVVCEALAHVGTMEMTTSAVLSGIVYRRIETADGRLTSDAVASALEPDTFYDLEMVDLLAVENTHGASGGTVLSIEELRAIGKVAADRGVPVYLDGARIFNASVASGVDVAEYAAEADALMFCVSKGLGAPIGSLLCGSRELVREGRRMKILFGGAWRQAGIVAAAGLIALEEGPKRLHEDHERARRLAEGVAEALPGAVDPDAVETNMVYAEPRAAGFPDALALLDRLRDAGVLATLIGNRVRMVTHLDVTDADVEETVSAWRSIAAESARTAEKEG
ncbi:MAG TPA: GntG family PLP-dependent aldolase [Actinomycetota bacterium]